MAKLEAAFMSGLRNSNVPIRQKFFEVFDSSIERRIHDRLWYIVSTQNWETMVTHFWIKQCLEVSGWEREGEGREREREKRGRGDGRPW